MEPSANDTTQPPERPPRLRIPLWAGVAALGIVALTVVAAVMGPRVSAPPQDCTAIGYSSLLTVTLDGDTSEVAIVQVLDGEQWQLIDFSDVRHLEQLGAEVTVHPGSPDVRPE